MEGPPPKPPATGVVLRVAHAREQRIVRLRLHQATTQPVGRKDGAGSTHGQRADSGMSYVVTMDRCSIELVFSPVSRVEMRQRLPFLRRYFPNKVNKESMVLPDLESVPEPSNNTQPLGWFGTFAQGESSPILSTS